MNLQPEAKIFISGHRGMVGSSIIRRLEQDGYSNLITIDRNDLDLRDSLTVQNFLSTAAPDCVIIAAAKVGGIHANDTYPADFLYDNLMIECNLIHGAYKAGTRSLIFLGSSCIYPKHATQPIAEHELLNGPLEPTNEAYAIAKIAGIKLCESYNRQHQTDYRSLMPTNLYGPNDNFHPQDSHVIPALLQRIHLAKENDDKSVVIWGSGTPKREFLHVDDLAGAVAFVMGQERNRYWQQVTPTLSHLNVGTGEDVEIRELANSIVEVVGYRGRLEFDSTKPDGTPRKLLDMTKLWNMGWKHRIGLAEGLRSTYQWYQENHASVRS